jgi:hypothetical protein
VIEGCYEKLKEDVLGLVLLGDFNARVGRSSDVDDVTAVCAKLAPGRRDEKRACAISRCKI